MGHTRSIMAGVTKKQRLTWIGYAQSIAREYGIEWNDERADIVLWEHTGFPAFWSEPELTPIANLERQLRRYIEEGPMDFYMVRHGELHEIIDVVPSL